MNFLVLFVVRAFCINSSVILEAEITWREKMGNHNKVLFGFGNVLHSRELCFKPDSPNVCAVGKPCKGNCGTENSYAYAVTLALGLDNQMISGSRYIDNAWWDLMEISKNAIPLSKIKTELQNKSTKYSHDTYAGYSRDSFYEMTACKSGCIVDRYEILKLIIFDFLCQNSDRLNRLYHHNGGDNLVHIFVDRNNHSKLVYIDNTCLFETKSVYKTPPKVYKQFGDWALDVRALVDVTPFYEKKVLCFTYNKHIVNTSMFMQKLESSLLFVHNDRADKQRELFLKNMRFRAKLLGGLLCPRDKL